MKPLDAGEIEPFDLQTDRHLFLQTATVIEKNKSRDSFWPIKVAAFKKQRKIELQVERLYRTARSRLEKQ